MHKHSINIVPNIILIDWNQCLMQVINQFDCDMMRHLDKQCAEMCVCVCVSRLCFSWNISSFFALNEPIIFSISHLDHNGGWGCGTLWDFCFCSLCLGLSLPSVSRCVSLFISLFLSLCLSLFFY